LLIKNVSYDCVTGKSVYPPKASDVEMMVPTVGVCAAPFAQTINNPHVKAPNKRDFNTIGKSEEFFIDQQSDPDADKKMSKLLVATEPSASRSEAHVFWIRGLPSQSSEGFANVQDPSSKRAKLS
jgi:hypothetical protein